MPQPQPQPLRDRKKRQSHSALDLPAATWSRVSISIKSRDCCPILQRLGISDLYLSPLFRAREESSHGYDVVDHGTIDPAIGDLGDVSSGWPKRPATPAWEFCSTWCPTTWASTIRATPGGSTCWKTAKARTSPISSTSTGSPRPAALQDKVLLPFLGEPFGRVLENGELQVVYDDERLQLCYWTAAISAGAADVAGRA